MKRILITGGSGFIGTNMVEFYRQQRDAEVINLDLSPPRNTAHTHLWKKVDLLDKEGLKQAIQAFAPTHVLHMGARTDLFERTDIKGYDVNITGVSNIVDVLRNTPGIQRVIFASSMLVCKAGYDPADYNDYCPPNLYGESKVLTEKIIKESNISEFEWCIIRPTSMWGPWFDKPYKDFFTMVINKRFFKLRGKSSRKTFGFIGNGVYQADQLLFTESDLINKKTFYIGDRPPYVVNEWADEVGGELGIKLPAMPYFVFKSLALIGDVFSLFRIDFPMTSFRLRNMQTDNVISLVEDTYKLIPKIPYTRLEGTRTTLEWMRSRNT